MTTETDIAPGAITTVQLPQSAAGQTNFLRKLQMALGAKASLPSLTPGPSANVYVIPQNAEQSLRGALSIQTDAA